MRIRGFIVLCLAATGLASVACGGGARVLTEEEVAARRAPTTTAAVEFPGYYGEHVAADTEFVLDSAGRAVDGVGVIVSLDKVQTIDYVEGEDREVEGTAHITVTRGAESTRVRVAAGETKTALGATISVSSAKIAYDDRAMDYIPQVMATVGKAP